MSVEWSGRERKREAEGGRGGVEDISTVADGRERGERLYGEKLSCPSVFVIRERPAGLEAEITSSDPKTNLPPTSPGINILATGGPATVW